MEEKLEILAKTGESFTLSDEQLVKEKQELMKEARERGHRIVKELNEAFEDEMELMEEKMLSEVATYERVMAENLTDEEQRIKTQYEKQKLKARTKFIREVFAYGHHEDERI